jgi:regulator of ribonuclease activity A
MLPRLLLLSGQKTRLLAQHQLAAASSSTTTTTTSVLASSSSASSSAASPSPSRVVSSLRSFASGPKSNQYPPADTARGATADLCDIFHPQNVDEITKGAPRTVQIAEPIFRDFGGKIRFSGRAATIKCYENNPLVRAALEEPGEGRVLVVDGGGSKRCALLGDNIAAMGCKNGWSGIVINGCVRDTADLATFDFGVKALAPFPLKSAKRDPGLRDVPVSFAGVTVKPGDWVYADGDGVLVSETELKLQSEV